MYCNRDEPYFLSASTVEGFKDAARVGLMLPGVPTLVEDYKPNRNAGTERQNSEEYHINLFGVRTATTCDARKAPLKFHAMTQKVFVTNYTEAQFFSFADGWSGPLKRALSKRCIFMTVTEMMPSAAAREEDVRNLDNIVAEGLRLAECRHHSCPT